MTSHVVDSFWPWVNSPALDEHGTSAPAQWPIVRAMLTGLLPVAVFVVVSGVVCSLKPLKQTRAGNVDDALSGLAFSTFRRTGRFVFPVFFLNAISWAMCQLGLFKIGHASQLPYIERTSPEPSGSVTAALYDLVYNIWTTWSRGSNRYDEHMWLLLPFLMGSFKVYLILLATAYVIPARRFAVYGLLYLYCFFTGDSLIGVNLVAGITIAELMQTGLVPRIQERLPWITYWLSAVFVFAGLYLGSFPEDNWEWAGWTRSMVILGSRIFPEGTEHQRMHPALGAQLIFVGILFNSGIQRLLTARWIVECGRVSWQIYLVHGTLLRTLLMIMVYAFSDTNAGVPMSTAVYARFLFAIPVFYVAVYLASAAWAATIDPLCSRITDWIERQLFRQDVFI